jgi:hypothetical protein
VLRDRSDHGLSISDAQPLWIGKTRGLAVSAAQRLLNVGSNLPRFARRDVDGSAPLRAGEEEGVFAGFGPRCQRPAAT